MDFKHNIVQKIKETNARIRPIVLSIAKKEAFKRFAIQRHYLTNYFVPLLQAAYNVSNQEARYKEIDKALLENIQDETGITQRGYSEELDHTTWRKNYLRALGIDVSEKKPIDATIAYNDALKTIMETKDYHHMVGALTFLEGQIPAEFNYIAERRDVLFPDEFVFQENDLTSVKRKKLYARRYIDDHIVHDAQSHFPDLLEPILELPKDEQLRIMEGVYEMSATKIHFYQGIENYLKT